MQLANTAGTCSWKATVTLVDFVTVVFLQRPTERLPVPETGQGTWNSVPNERVPRSVGMLLDPTWIKLPGPASSID